MMADEKENAGSDAPAEEAVAPETAEAQAAPTEAAPAGVPPAPSAEEFAVMKDKLLRTLAEMENLRRRTEREITDTRQYAVANFAREVLAVGDNLRRAIDAVPEGMRHVGDKTLTALVEGVELTERALQQTLKKFGVRRVEAEGQKFDPSLHQAIYEVEADDVPAGIVTKEIQTGYAIGERVLRPTLVAIAKKKPEPAEPLADEPREGAPANIDSSQPS